MNRFGAGRQTK